MMPARLEQQAEHLALLAREVPEVESECSGGVAAARAE